MTSSNDIRPPEDDMTFLISIPSSLAKRRTFGAAEIGLSSMVSSEFKGFSSFGVDFSFLEEDFSSFGVDFSFLE